MTAVIASDTIMGALVAVMQLEADISIGYIFKILELRAGMWLMDTDGANALWGPYVGVAIWF